MKAEPKYVIILTNGRAENVKEGLGWFDILNQVADVFHSAGGNTPLGETLMRNGKIVVAEGLMDIAYRYRKADVAARNAALAEVQAQFPEPAP